MESNDTVKGLESGKPPGTHLTPHETLTDAKVGSRLPAGEIPRFNIAA